MDGLQRRMHVRLDRVVGFFALLIGFSLLLLPYDHQTAQAQDEAITATVVVSALNVRAGPGTSFARLGTVRAGDELVVLGKSGNCIWLYVRLADDSEGWVSGAARYVTLNGRCADVLVTRAANSPAPGATPQATATRRPAPATQPPPTATSQSTPLPPPTATNLPSPTPEPQATDSFPADMACIMFDNRVGPELTVTMTGKNSRHVEEPKVPPGGNVIVCIPPDAYSVTIDAPPPWADINADIKVNAGDRILWPIEGRP